VELVGERTRRVDQLADPFVVGETGELDEAVGEGDQLERLG
jgi:hypothetical protein